MKIDKNPIITKSNRTIEVSHNIDSSEEVAISINGVIVLLPEDYESITNNIITLKENLDIDYDDNFVVFYTKGY
jgi:hypothetical protein